MKENWAKYALKRYMLLKNWKKHATIIAKACKETLGEKCLQVYVVGGAAENRLTVLSDIDIVITVNDNSLKTIETILAIKRKAREIGLPDEAPIDLKILTPNEFNKLVNKGIYKKTIKIKTH